MQSRFSCDIQFLGVSKPRSRGFLGASNLQPSYNRSVGETVEVLLSSTICLLINVLARVLSRATSANQGVFGSCMIERSNGREHASAEDNRLSDRGINERQHDATHYLLLCDTASSALPSSAERRERALEHSQRYCKRGHRQGPEWAQSCPHGML